MTSFPVITSIKDPKIVEARELTSAAGRKRAQQCLLEGEEIIRWVLQRDLPIAYVLFHNRIETHPLLETLTARAVPCYAVSDGILKKVTDTHYLVPFVGVAPVRDLPAAGAPRFVILLDGVQDHGNIGTIIRTAQGFGIRDIATSSPDFDLYYRKLIEASRGHIFDVRLTRYASSAQAVHDLKARGFQIVATSSYGDNLQTLAKLEDKPLVLVVGNETGGVSEAVLKNADLVVQIPMQSQVESLNVAVATGISVYELKLKLVITMLIHYIRTTLGREVNVAAKLVQRALDATLARVSHFNGTQVILMMVLKCDSVMTLEQAGKDIAVFGEELQALLAPLFAEKYIVYADPDGTSLRLTDEGSQLLGKLWGLVEASEDQILEGFSAAEKQQLLDYLQRIQTNCTRIISV
ncbi:MAG: RNA methyltransferase [Anaerolineae bacterium]|nr:RNA methyltransferase [Anaerolineae bacterium]